MDKDKFLKYLENEIRFYKELGEEFDERRYELITIQTKVNKGEFD